MALEIAPEIGIGNIWIDLIGGDQIGRLWCSGQSPVERDTRPPHLDRAKALLRCVNAFYDAFDIHEGDPISLEPELIVKAWLG